MIQPTRPDAAELATPGNAKAWKAAQAFETMALGQFLSPMFDTVKPGEGLFGGGAGEDQWRPMMTQEIAKQIEKSGGLGIAVPVYRQMLQMQEAAKETPK